MKNTNNEKNFLLKVLGLSGIPRIVSFLFTLISFPLMLRKVGASQYGVIVYLTSIIAVVESLADFGVSSAAGKCIAAIRVSSEKLLRQEISSWWRFQFGVATFGIIPMFIISYLIIKNNQSIPVGFDILMISIATSWITIMTNFVRSILTATLSFKSLALVDSIESISRSSSFLLVAFIMPTVVGLAVALFSTAALVALVAVLILIKQLRKLGKETNYENAVVKEKSSRKNMFIESLSFLWLRFATRCFQAIPPFLFGRFFNSEIVGIVGTISRIVDLITFPFAVVGNALSVRAREVIKKGNGSVMVLWDTLFRLISVAIILWATTLIGTDIFAKLLFGNHNINIVLIAILTCTILTTSVSVLINPLTDYVGALNKRNLLLSILTLIQIPFIWIGILLGGEIGGMISYVLVLIILCCGYIIVCLNAFFDKKNFYIRKEFVHFINIAFAGIAMSFLFQKGILTRFFFEHNHHLTISLFSIIFFLILICIAILYRKKLRYFYITRNFFEFQIEHKEKIVSEKHNY
ncbi:lipopolysaccharide biosynthesis protein [Asinibacterium sp. OR53]|uniref:lipopolysaccharide biosynthesis protein n=1 Tax=Asinibacterium sp. OR53 TaxID=925409 RepID=UPI0004B3027B|nr:oligosaccharide flippase family protein [Asinibacterium sp. OR53]